MSRSRCAEPDSESLPGTACESESLRLGCGILLVVCQARKEPAIQRPLPRVAGLGLSSARRSPGPSEPGPGRAAERPRLLRRPGLGPWRGPSTFTLRAENLIGARPARHLPAPRTTTDSRGGPGPGPGGGLTIFWSCCHVAIMSVGQSVRLMMLTWGVDRATLASSFSLRN